MPERLLRLFFLLIFLRRCYILILKRCFSFLFFLLRLFFDLRYSDAHAFLYEAARSALAFSAADADVDADMRHAIADIYMPLFLCHNIQRDMLRVRDAFFFFFIYALYAACCAMQHSSAMPDNMRRKQAAR